MTYCSNPARNHGDGRGCGMDDCPRHGGNEPGGEYDLQSELDRLEREDPAVQAAAASLDAVGEHLKDRLPPDAVKAIWDEPVLRDPWDLDDAERGGY